jgi:hypothetical protein
MGWAHEFKAACGVPRVVNTDTYIFRTSATKESSRIVEPCCRGLYSVHRVEHTRSSEMWVLGFLW